MGDVNVQNGATAAEPAVQLATEVCFRLAGLEQR